MTVFTGTTGADTASTLAVNGFTGGNASHLTDAEDDVFVCLGDDDVVTAGGTNDTLIGGEGVDTLDGAGGSDTYEYAIGDLNFGFLEVINDTGLTGIDTIRLVGSAVFFFRNTATISGIEALTFTGNQNAEFNANQLPSDLAITSVDGIDQRIVVADATNFSAANWTFTSWESIDLVFLIGTTGSDSITGSSQRDLIQAQGGADTLNGRGGGDTYQINGDATGLVLNDTGASGTDTIQVFSTVDLSVATTIAGIEALEISDASTATFLASHLPANLAVKGDNANSQTIAIQGATSFSAAGWTFTDWQSANDLITINGTASNNTITGSTQDDRITGGLGNDTINGIGGSDTALFAGADSTYTVRRVDAVSTSWVVTDTSAGVDGDDGADTLTGIERLTFLGNATTFIAANLIGALSDSDGDANSVSEGAAAGTEVNVAGLAVDGNGDGITYSLTNNAGGRFQIDASGVVKVLDASLLDFEPAASHNIVVRATSGDGSFTEKQFTISIGFAPINGTTAGEVLDGSNKIDIISGLAGNDTLNGLGNADTLTGGLGADTQNGGEGNDTFKIGGSEGNGDILDGGNGTDKIDVTGSSALTLASYSKSNSIETWTGNGKGVIGTSAANSFDFSALTSVSSLGLIDGKSGNDTIVGSKVKETIIGGAGKDLLTGKAGNDIFDFNSKSETVKGSNRDQILDFKRGQDKIDLSTIDADTSSNSGNDKFAFIGSAKFKGGGGELRFSSGILQGDINGDKVADFEIKVNVSTMVGGDFFL